MLSRVRRILLEKFFSTLQPINIKKAHNLRKGRNGFTTEISKTFTDKIGECPLASFEDNIGQNVDKGHRKTQERRPNKPS